ncbi:MAG: hypothetical protein JW778_01195 [Candidatus Altiarchaeota archaeon]|nr:hypothetical protein [Candidatus Altiarchaeota archaeon]
MADKPIMEQIFNEGIDVDAYLKDGAILGRLFIEVQSNDREAAEKALKKTIFEGLAGEKHVKLMYAKLYDIQKYKDKDSEFFSGVVEIKLLVMDFRWFVSVVMRYGPSAIEIMEPDKVTLSMDEMQSLLADVSEIAQTYSSKIISLLKDDERKKLYGKILAQD